MGLLHTLHFLTTHPLGRLGKAETLGRFVQWQLASRLSPGPIAIPFIADGRLLVARGMAAATGNLYVGLHEFADMAFVLHALRPTDVFFDVGANIGSYTVLASKVVGAHSVAIEPIGKTVAHLRDNLALNAIEDRVRLEACAVGETAGSVYMTPNEDSINRVVDDDDTGSREVVEVPCRTLDEIIGSGPGPQIMKMDIEGFELPALRGATRMLSNPELRACIVEIWSRSAADERAAQRVQALLASFGFHTATYDGFTRTLRSTNGLSGRSNTLFIRDRDWIEDRVRSGPTFSVLGHQI
jgi:FkbM family methyltransferase